MKFNLDHYLFVILASAMTLLITPRIFLLNWQWILILCLVLGLGYIGVKAVFFRCVLKLFFIFVLGVGFFHYQALNLLEQSEHITRLPKKVQTNVKIAEIIQQKDYQAVIAEGKFTSSLPTQRIYLNWRTEQEVQVGEIWQVNMHIRPISSRLNIGGFDRQTWYLAKEITAYATVKSAVKIGEDFSWRATRLNQALQQTSNLVSQGLLLALGFGERAWLDKELWQLYQQTNTAHLIAISGLHIGLAMFIGFTLGRAIQLLFPTRYIEPYFPLILGIFLAFCYAELAGFSIPTFRAIVALFIVCLCRICRVSYNVWQLFLRVICVLLILNPFMLLSASFWLSIGAVGCLIMWYQWIPLNLFLWKEKPLAQSSLKKVRYFIGLFHLQFGLLWFFTPIQLLIFNGIALNGFWANLLLLPLFSFLLVPLILFAVLTEGALNSWNIADQLAIWINQLLKLLPNQWINISLAESYFISAILALLFTLCCKWIIKCSTDDDLSLLRKVRKKSFYPIRLNFSDGFSHKKYQYGMVVSSAMFVIFLCLWFFSLYEQGRLKNTQWQFDTLDVGQGLASLLVKNQHGILYDTGASWKNGSMAKIEIIPYLRRQGIILDKVILSHDDNDHAGGVKDIFQAYPNAEFISPSLKKYENSPENRPHITCQKGKIWHWQGLYIEALSPSKIVMRANNPDSCVLIISDGQHKVLLTGDADVATEYKILSDLGKIDVLQVGHHGSKTSTGEKLLQHIQPKIALISSGRWNPWGFPHQDVVKRLNAVESAVYNTAISGQIRLTFKGKDIQIQTARTEFSPWYRGLIGL